MTDLQDRLERTLAARADGITPDTRLLRLTVHDGARQRRRRRVVAGVAAGSVLGGAVLAAVLGFLSPSSPAAPEPAVPPPADTGPVIAALEPAEVMPAARVRGTLVLERGCLLVESRTVPGDTSRNVVMWPAGTTWDAEARSVVVDERNRYRVGGEVDGGGGYYEPATDMSWILGGPRAEDIAGCGRATGADGFVLFYPADAG